MSHEKLNNSIWVFQGNSSWPSPMTGRSGSGGVLPAIN